MIKVITLSAVLGLSALGLACGDTPANNTNTRVNAVVVTSTPVSTSTPAMVPANNSATPANGAAMRTANGNTMPMANANANRMANTR